MTGQAGFRVPADVEREDKILAGLTARQCAILAAVAVALWLAYTLTSSFVPLWTFAGLALPVAAGGGLVAVGRRDGIGLDRFLLAAVGFAHGSRRLVPTGGAGVALPPAWVAAVGDLELPAPLRLPATGVDADGVIDLGPDGTAAIIACGTMNLALASSEEQHAHIAAFARVLHTLTVPAQILVRAQPVDLAPMTDAIVEAAPALPHPALEDAAIEHARYLSALASRRDLLSRQVLVVIRAPGSSGRSTTWSGRSSAGGGERSVLRQADQLARALSGIGILARRLPGAEAHAVLATCCDPTAPAPTRDGGAA